jgi:hypothetical protein
MRLRITIILLLANIATFGLIWKLEHDKERDPAVRAPLFAPVIRKITFDGQGVPQPYTLERSQGGWRVTDPFVWEANPAAVEHILEQLRFIDEENGFTLAEAKANGSSLANYGLEKPEARLTVLGESGAAPVVIHIGRVGADRDNAPVYVLSPGERIIAVPSGLYAALMTSHDSLRANTIFTLGSFEVRNITIRATPPLPPPTAVGAPAPVPAVRDIRIKRDFRPLPNRTDTEPFWRFETPFEAEANRPLVEASLGQLANLRYQRFLPRPASSTPETLQQQYGLAQPPLRLTLEGSNRLQTLLVGARDPESPPNAPVLFAKLENNNAVFTIREADVKIWREAPTLLREREFFRFHPEQLTEITINKGAAKLVFHRLGGVTPDAQSSAYGEWNIPAIPGTTAKATLATDPAIMRALIDDLRRLAAQTYLNGDLPPARQWLCEAFVSDAPSEAQLKALALDKPALRVELAFGKDAPRRVLLLAPPVVKGTPAHAKLESSPPVYSIREDILETLSTSPAKYRNRLVDSLPDGAFISGIKITDLAAPAVPLVSAARAAPDALWTPAPPAASKLTPEDDPLLRALAAQLAKVRAREYSEKSFSRDYKYNHLGAETPDGWRYQLEYTLRRAPAAAEETRTLFFTPRLGGTTQIAGNPARDCVFRAEQPLIDALFPLTLGKDSSRDIPTISVPPDLPPAPAADGAPPPAVPPPLSTPPPTPAAPPPSPAAPTPAPAPVPVPAPPLPAPALVPPAPAPAPAA